MRRRCATCGKLREDIEFIGPMCGRCDKIAADADVDLFIGGD